MRPVVLREVVRTCSLFFHWNTAKWAITAPLYNDSMQADDGQIFLELKVISETDRHDTFVFWYILAAIKIMPFRKAVF